MEEEQIYANGFNRGYLIAKHEPDLAAKLAGIENNTPFFTGMMDGKKQYEHEVREWSKGFTRNAPDKDDREPERDR